MKKFGKLAAILLPALVLAMALPGIACAQTEKKDTVYVRLDSATCYTDTGQYTDSTVVKYATGYSILKDGIKDVKSSNSDVATAEVVQTNGIYMIKVTCKTKGKTTISWKKDGTTYKQKFVVKNHVNPFKKLKANSKKIGKKFGTDTNVIKLKYSKWKNKEITFKYKTKGNWKVATASSFTRDSDGIADKTYNEDNHITSSGDIEDSSSFTTKVHKKGQEVKISVSKTNSKNGATYTEDFYIRFV